MSVFLTEPLVLFGSVTEQVSFSADSLSLIDQIVQRSILEGRTPGAVVLVAHQGEVVFEKSFGNRSLEPSTEPMTLDTAFDLASLTKVVATTPAFMLLLQKGKLKLDDPVVKFIPTFGKRGKNRITLRQLLTHYSGLPADLKLPKRRKISAKSLLSRIYQVKLVAPPGERFIYSDLGFIVLGKVVEKVSRQPLDQFTQKNLFAPLGMISTGFFPPAHMQTRIAPTEKRRDGSMMRGEVHDPLASGLGGAAGNAGLFSTAQDLARFCFMLLNRGSLDGVEIFKPEVVDLMTSPQSPQSKPNIRGLGWDIQSVYSSVKGDFFSAHSYGHTGFTGTSLWLDPETRTFVIILANRVHPNGKGDVKALRTQIANVVGAAVSPTRQGNELIPLPSP